MSHTTTSPTAVDAPRAARIDNLDTVRGVAVLGILAMNIVSFGLGSAGYFNLDDAGSNTWLDWTVGVAGEVLIDQKFMGLFSLLFGAGIVLFADRCEATGVPPVRRSLWRNTLLLLIGLGHTLLWDGDVLVVYALAAPILLLVRKLGIRTLWALGAGVFLVPSVAVVFVQSAIDDDVGGYWFSGEPFGDAVGAWVILDVFCRAIGMMMIGIALYRSGFLHGQRDPADYRRWAAIGLAVGLPLAIVGVAWQLIADFEPDIALVSTVPNSLATVPMTLAYLALITLWNQRRDRSLHQRMRAVGRMALTNYLTQTVLGLLIADVLFDNELGRSGLVVVMFSIWAAQLAWSPWWLDRYRFGPVEWLWRSATRRRLEPLRA